VRFTQDCPHVVCPVPQTLVQAPAEQTWPVRHTCRTAAVLRVSHQVDANARALDQRRLTPIHRGAHTRDACWPFMQPGRSRRSLADRRTSRSTCLAQRTPAGQVSPIGEPGAPPVGAAHRSAAGRTPARGSAGYDQDATAPAIAGDDAAATAGRRSTPVLAGVRHQVDRGCAARVDWWRAAVATVALRRVDRVAPPVSTGVRLQWPHRRILRRSTGVLRSAAGARSTYSYAPTPACRNARRD